MEPNPHQARQPKVYIETYGCQMNVADSRAGRARVLRRAGYADAERPEDADVILLNTCAIREHAEERVLGRLGELARHKPARPEVQARIAGCMAQHNRDRAGEKPPFARLRRRTRQRIAACRNCSARAGVDPPVDVRLDRAETYADIVPRSASGVRAWVTIMRGCDKFCTFCVVPYVRGRERSVPAEAILMREVRDLAARGVREVVYSGRPSTPIATATSISAELLRMTAAIDGIERIRFTSPHPVGHDRVGDRGDGDRAKVHARSCICRCNPAPTACSPRWNAATRSTSICRLVERVRAAIPGIALSTDIIVGFHGEEDSDFGATLALMRTVRYDSAFTFKYSLRENTRAYRLGDTVSEEEKGRRLAEVIALQEPISVERNRATLGQVFPVLVEGPARRGDGMLAGKTPQFKTAIFRDRRYDPHGRDESQSASNPPPATR